MIFHDNVDEVVDGAVFISDKNFTVENFVISENIVDHLLIDIFGWCLKRDFHAAGGFRFEIDVSGYISI